MFSFFINSLFETTQQSIVSSLEEIASTTEALKTTCTSQGQRFFVQPFYDINENKRKAKYCLTKAKLENHVYLCYFEKIKNLLIEREKYLSNELEPHLKTERFWLSWYQTKIRSTIAEIKSLISLQQGSNLQELIQIATEQKFVLAEANHDSRVVDLINELVAKPYALLSKNI